MKKKHLSSVAAIWKSRSITDYGIFSIYSDYYEDKNREKIEIKAIGIFNTFHNK